MDEPVLTEFLVPIARWVRRRIRATERRVVAWTRPVAPGMLHGALVGVTQSKVELVAENALLRQQLIVLRRQVKRPRVTTTDRLLLVLLARYVRLWRDALLIVQPDTLLRWHRAGFRLVWTHRSRVISTKPKIAAETIALIREMAVDNRLWGAERIRGELLKLGVHVSKRTVQKYLRRGRPRRAPSQTWATFLQNHARDIWACDFLQVTDLSFRSFFAFFIVDHSSRRVVHLGVTRHPTDAWVAQQLREATPFGEHPRFLLHDNDNKYGAAFARVAETNGIEIIRTPCRTPRANGLCERFLGSVRRECLDHILILHERQLSRALRGYVAYFNEARPHQGIGQNIPEWGQRKRLQGRSVTANAVVAVPILGGLHHDYRCAA